MLGTITTEAQIDGPTVSIISAPNVATFSGPPLSNGVSNHQQVDSALPDAWKSVLMLRNPPRFGSRNRRYCRRYAIEGLDEGWERERTSQRKKYGKAPEIWYASV